MAVDPRSRAALDRARRVHSACERFETAWRADRPPRIEDELAGAEPSDHDELLAELLALEIEIRHDRGEWPTPREYLDRFPAHPNAIAAAFDDVTRFDGSAPDDRTAIHPRVGPPTLEVGPNPRSSSQRLYDVDLGDFELIEEIARGGMGIVYKARKRSLNRIVALKLIQGGPRATEAEKSRFLFEAEAAANLDHPGIVPVFEIDREHGLYFTMKWIDGDHLGRQVLRLLDDPRETARIVASVARAVHDAHLRGFLHRDLKPANILLDAQGRAFLTDFGLARRVGQESGLTRTGAILGTPCYMAPEQAGGLGKDAGPEADIYSLGAILYELLTGGPPFRAGTIMETIVQVLERDPAPPRRLRPGVPEELEAISLKCLEKDPANRYPTAEALADDLDRYLRHEAVEAARAGPWARLRRWGRREPQLVTRLAGLAVVGTLTQVNFLVSSAPNLKIHLQASAILATWAIASVLLQAVARRDRWRAAVRPAWTAVDVVLITATLWCLDAVDNSAIVGYPVVVVASGLWYRVGLVWLATALAEIGYGLLVLDAWLRETIWDRVHHPNIVMAAIAITGFVVARQVRRLLALSTYYENRAPS